ncbi:MAG: flagellar motor switch protein FliN [Candidatus Margulisbacteria bacterium]|nr:flagellar motor switch protein FliN [Candidatus Margulisiibacteriota bacterium]
MVDKEANLEQEEKMDAPADTSLPPNIEDQKNASEPQLKTLANENFKNGSNDISIITEIPLELSVELGRTKKSIKDILNFGIGTVVELEKIAGEHVDLLANGKLLAKGEVVVVDDNFAIRITEIINNKQNTKND